jgi:hypothetical protein
MVRPPGTGRASAGALTSDTDLALQVLPIAISKACTARTQRQKIPIKVSGKFH